MFFNRWNDRKDSSFNDPLSTSRSKDQSVLCRNEFRVWSIGTSDTLISHSALRRLVEWRPIRAPDFADVVRLHLWWQFRLSWMMMSIPRKESRTILGTISCFITSVSFNPFLTVDNWTLGLIFLSAGGWIEEENSSDIRYNSLEKLTFILENNN